MDSKKVFNKKYLKKKRKEQEAQQNETAEMPRKQSNVSEVSHASLVSEEKSSRKNSHHEAEAELKIEEEKIVPKNMDNSDKYFSSIKFKDLNLSEQTQKAVESLGF